MRGAQNLYYFGVLEVRRNDIIFVPQGHFLRGANEVDEEFFTTPALLKTVH